MATNPIPTKRRPRFYRAEKPLPLTITPRHEQFLKLIAQYDYLDGPQLQRLMGLSRCRTAEVLTDLKHGGAGNRFYIRACKDYKTYVLDHAGYKYLQDLECAPPGRFRPDEMADKQPSYLNHLHDTTSLLIAIQQSGIPINRILSDADLHRTPLKVSIPVKDSEGRWKKNKEPMTLIPDTFAAFDLGNDLEQAVCFEIDRGNAQNRAIKGKIYGYLESIKGEYQRVLDAQSLVVAFLVTSPGELTINKRCVNLLSWIEEVLTDLQSEKLAPYFRVSAINLDKGTCNIFTQAMWCQPFKRPDRKDITLLDYQPVKLWGG